MKDNASTPAKNLASPNITPRSGSRRARAEAPSPKHARRTPAPTPTTSRPQSSTERRDKYAVDVKSPTAFVASTPTSGRTSRSESLLSDSNGPSLAQRPGALQRNNSSYSSSGIISPQGSSTFFHADDVQATTTPKQRIDKAPSHSKPQGWVRMDQEESRDRIPPIVNDSAPDEQTPKFFYANDHSASKSPPPRLQNTVPSNRPPLQTIYSAHGAISPQRAPSPLKEEITPPRRSSISQASPRRHTRLVSNGGSEIKAPDAIKTDLSRRSSLNSRTGARTSTSRIRSPSMHSIDGSSNKRNSTIQPTSSPTEPTKRLSMNGVSGALPLNVKPPTSSFSFSQEYNSPLSPSLSQSPTAPQSKIEQMNELAAKARRERKVLDLEISNSSLLAINRTLEREMRKQTSELRHLRRLNRSGRLSSLPNTRSGQKYKLSEIGNLSDSDDLESSDSEDDEESEEGRSTKSFASRDPDSPNGRTDRGRFHDTERPPLDLTAHRTLLLESQKINQAMKRCLSHTDAMIASGKQALKAQIHDLDPEALGPRVLTPDEDDGAFERGQALLSPSLYPDNLSINPWEQSLAPLGSLDGSHEPPSHSHPTSAPTDLPTTPTNAHASTTTPPSSSPSLPPPTPTPIHLPSSPPSLPRPSLPPSHDLSFQASLDGLSSLPPSPSPSSSSQTTSPTTPPATQNPPAPHLKPHLKPHPHLEPHLTNKNELEAQSRPPSPTRPPPTTNAAANAPGNRSSIQNLGTYFGFQNLGLFGQGGG